MRIPITTQDLKLSAALQAYGFKPFIQEDGSDAYIKLATDKGVSVTFFFEELNDDGENIRDFIGYYYSDTWCFENPDHRFTIAISTVRNIKTLMDIVKQAPAIRQAIIKGQLVTISDDLPQKDKDLLLAKL